MHYVTRRSKWMKKRKFGVTCLIALFLESVPDAKTHVWRDLSHRAFVEFVPIQAEH
jgi:hypothetical protein